MSEETEILRRLKSIEVAVQRLVDGQAAMKDTMAENHLALVNAQADHERDDEHRFTKLESSRSLDRTVGAVIIAIGSIYEAFFGHRGAS